MKNPKRKVSIVGLCDSVMHMVRTLCREYLAQTASDRELLCGEWVRPGGRVILRVRKEGGRYLLDECWSNTVNSRIQVFTFRLLGRTGQPLHRDSGAGYRVRPGAGPPAGRLSG